MTEQNTGGQPSDAEDWYALGVKDGRDGCLVELDALQARCDKLEAERNQVIQELVEKALNDAAKICQERYLPDERAKVLRYLSEWLKSQMEGEA